jgi:hypothetical protein
LVAPILLLHLNALAEPEDRACIRKEYNKEYNSNTKLSPQAIARHLKDAPFVGVQAVERIRQKPKPLQGLHVTHVNSIYLLWWRGGYIAGFIDLFDKQRGNQDGQDGMEQFTGVAGEFH